MKFLLATLCTIVLVVAASAADDDKKHDFRNDFDRLLMEEIEQKMNEFERGLLMLTEQYKELEKTKNKELKEQMLRELTIGTNYAKQALGFMERQQQRDDLDLFEKYNYDVAVEAIKILIKDMAALAKKVMAINPDEFDVNDFMDFYFSDK